LKRGAESDGVSFFICSWVARWFVFKPKIPIWVNFGVCRMLVYYWPFGLFYGHRAYCTAFWYISR
jgi:hypothetical protein